MKTGQCVSGDLSVLAWQKSRFGAYLLNLPEPTISTLVLRALIAA